MIEEPVVNKGDEILFADAAAAVENTENVGYLGDRDVVDGIIRSAAFDVMDEISRISSSDAASEIVMKVGRRELRTFLGGSKYQQPMPGWNKPGAIDTFVAKWAGIDDADPMNRLVGAFAVMIGELLDITGYAATGVPDESWQWQVDAVLERYVDMFMGISPVVSALMSMPEEEPPDGEASVDGLTTKFNPYHDDQGRFSSGGGGAGGEIGTSVPPPISDVGIDNVQQSYIDDAAKWDALTASEDEYYHLKMSRVDSRVSAVQQKVAAIEDRLDKKSKAHGKECAKLDAMLKAVPPGEDMTKHPKIMEQSLRVDTALGRYVKAKESQIKDAWNILRKDAAEHKSDSVIKKVVLKQEGTNAEQGKAIKELQDRLSGVLSTQHNFRVEEMAFRPIPAGEKQRPYFAGYRHDRPREVAYLTELSNVGTAAHEFGHALETNVNTSVMAQAFLHSRVAGEAAKPMGASYDKWEVGRDDKFEAAFGGSARYVGKHYKSHDTEVISMGLEKMVTDPVRFAKRDPEYFKFMVAVVNGSVL